MILPRDYDSDAIFFSFLSSPITRPLSTHHRLLLPIHFLPLSSTSSLRLRHPLFSFRILVPWGCPLYYTRLIPRTVLLGYEAMYDSCCEGILVYKDWVMYPEVPSCPSSITCESQVPLTIPLISF
jgi:hypothetical protein